MISTFKQFIRERYAPAAPETTTPVLEYTNSDVKTLNTFMNKKKVKHSCNVALLLKKMRFTKDSYNAALYHDFIERGGTEDELRGAIGDHATELVLAVTITDTDTDNFDSDNLTLDVLKRKIHRYPEAMANEIILIKICDRLDNLRKRRKEGALNKRYTKKSGELLNFLLDEYTGTDKAGIRAFVVKKLGDKYPKLRLNAPAPLVDVARVDEVPGEHVLPEQDGVFELLAVG